MNTPHETAKPAPVRASARRARYGVSTAVLIVAAAVVCVLGAWLASKFAVRWDLTATRQYTLSPRTTAVLRASNDPATIIVSADESRLDRGARDRLRDVLTEFERTAPRVRTRWIDTSSAAGPAQFEALLRDVATSKQSELDEQRAAIERAAASASELPAALGRVSDLLKQLATLSATRDDLERQAGLVRTIAARLTPVAEELTGDARFAVAGVSIPAADSARARTSAIDDAARALAAVADFATKLAAASPDGGEVQQAARALAGEASPARDAATRAGDELSRLRASDPLIVARILQAGDAVLITGAGGTLAIDWAALFPQGASADEASASSVLFAGEALLSTAIAGLSDAKPPVAVFVHAELGRLIEPGGVSPAGQRALGAVFDRLRLARVEPMEWAVAIDALRPVTPADRPVVWIVLPAPSRASAEVRGGSSAERVARVQKLGDALRTLVADARNVLVSVDVSDLPAVGEPDPIAAALEPLGVSVRSSHALLRRESTPQGQATMAFQVIVGGASDHPVASAVRGLPIVTPWASAMELRSNGPLTTTPLLLVPASAGAWGESEWTRIRELVARGAVRPLEGMLLADSPTPDAVRDASLPQGAPGWVVAATSETVTAGAAPHRAVIVASPGWIDNSFTRASDTVSGRPALLFPGNLELFDASVQWLAGQDGRIAPGPESRGVPRIGEIEAGTLSALRWLLVAGLPVLVLTVGGLLRVLRG